MEISTAADFEKKAADRRAAAAVPLTLPSGLTILAYCPQLEWWLRHLGRLPQSMALRVSRESGSSPVTGEEILTFALWASKLMAEIFVSPKLKLDPGPGEVDPSLVSDEDLTYLMRFAGGEIAADGQGLDTFSGERGTDAAPGANSTAVA